MANGWLKSAAKTLNVPKESVIVTMKKNMQGYEKGRSRNVVHASDITKPDFCPRNEAFLDMQSVTHGKEQFISAALRATFDIGSETERLIVEKWGGEAIVGNWNCRTCGKSKSMSTKPLDGCNGLSKCDWRYMQWVAYSLEYGVSGSVDSLWNLGTPLWMMAELKIMAPDEFEKIIAPLPEHRLRTALYLKLIADSDSVYVGKVNLFEARVIYTSRAYGKKNDAHGGEILPWKEYVVERNDEEVQPILNKAKQLKIFRETKAMPSGICPTALDPKAKKCSNCAVCFSGTHPAQQEAL